MSKFSKQKFFTSIFASSVLIISACVPNLNAPNDQTGIFQTYSDKNMTIINDNSKLSNRVKKQNKSIEIIPSKDFKTQQDIPISDTVKLTLVAEVDAPIVGGTTVQATSIVAKDNFIIVSYNTKGDQYRGVTDIFDISDKDNPILTGQCVFHNADVSSVGYDSGLVYMAHAGQEADLPSNTAFLRRLDISPEGDFLPLTVSKKGLAGFAATHVFSSPNKVYATSGDNAGLTVLNKQTFESEKYFELHDARWVDAENGKVAVAQGTPGKLTVINEDNLTIVNTHNVTGMDIPESKSTVEIEGDKAFIAAGTGGVQILGLDNGTVLGSIPQPKPDGMDPNKAVTNAVSVDDNLAFISSGEAGIYVARNEQSFDSTDGNTPVNLEVLGKLGFGNLISANHILYRNNCLVVATGLGGVKILTVEEKPTTTPSPSPSPSASPPACPASKDNGCGFNTKLKSISDNGNNSYTINIEVSHDGSKDSQNCKEISHFSIEADPNTYSNVSFSGTNGNLDLGPNLGSDAFDGFKLDNMSGLGNGQAGSFEMSYTLNGGLQDQQFSVKAGTNSHTTTFNIADFQCNIDSSSN